MDQPRQRTRWGALAACFAALPIWLGGCGEDEDPKTVERGVDVGGQVLAREIQDDVQQETGDDVQVNCPPAPQGLPTDEFVDCSATIGTVERKLRVTSRGDGARWQLFDFLDPEVVEQDIERGFRRRGTPVTAECERVPIGRDAVSRCSATAVRATYDVQARQTDDIGTARWDVARRQPKERARK